jgi:hypothetical protein
MARPREYDYLEIAKLLNEYTENTEIPIIAEFCYLNDIPRDYLYKMGDKEPELLHAIKRCTMRKEVVLEKGTLTGVYDKTMAIFSLKQLGWKDKQEIEHSGGTNNTNEIKHDLSKLDVKELKQLETLLTKSEGD